MNNTNNEWMMVILRLGRMVINQPAAGFQGGESVTKLHRHNIPPQISSRSEPGLHPQTIVNSATSLLWDLRTGRPPGSLAAPPMTGLRKTTRTDRLIKDDRRLKKNWERTSALSERWSEAGLDIDQVEVRGDGAGEHGHRGPA